MDSTTSVVVATWGGGGNLPPLLAVARLLAGQGHHVRVLASARPGRRPSMPASRSSVIRAAWIRRSMWPSNVRQIGC
jgi:hypothetical protein